MYANLERLAVHAEQTRHAGTAGVGREHPHRRARPKHRFVSMPLHTLNPDGTKGLARRQCTSEYKIIPLKKAARELMGYPHPRRMPRGVYAEQAIGISTDEITRAKDSRLRFLRNVFPLIDLGFDRAPVYGVPCRARFRGDGQERVCGVPVPWQRGLALGARQRPGRLGGGGRVRPRHPPRLPARHQQGQQLRGQYFLHRSCLPLDQVDLDTPATSRTKKHLRLITADSADVLADGVDEDGDPDGCSPWSCRSGEPVAAITASKDPVRREPAA